MKIVLMSAAGPDNHRTRFARTTWPEDYHLITCERTAADIGDPRGLFYIKDVLDNAFKIPGDIYCYVNNDVALATDWMYYLRSPIEQFGCCCSHRQDVPKFFRPMNSSQLNGVANTPYCGADFIAFTANWWKLQRETFPDAVLGLEGWDGAMQIVMRRSGFSGMPTICFHETHGVPYWTQHIHSPENVEVRRRITTWAHRYGAEQYLGAGQYLFKAMADLHPVRAPQRPIRTTHEYKGHSGSLYKK